MPNKSINNLKDNLNWNSTNRVNYTAGVDCCSDNSDDLVTTYLYDINHNKIIIKNGNKDKEIKSYDFSKIYCPHCGLYKDIPCEEDEIEEECEDYVIHTDKDAGYNDWVNNNEQ